MALCHACTIANHIIWTGSTGTFENISKPVHGREKGVYFSGMVKSPQLPGQIHCWLGFHDFRMVDVTFGFGTDAVEKDVCRRCGVTRIRRA